MRIAQTVQKKLQTNIDQVVDIVQTYAAPKSALFYGYIAYLKNKRPEDTIGATAYLNVLIQEPIPENITLFDWEMVMRSRLAEKLKQLLGFSVKVHTERTILWDLKYVTDKESTLKRIKEAATTPENFYPKISSEGESVYEKQHAETPTTEIHEAQHDPQQEFAAEAHQNTPSDEPFQGIFEKTEKFLIKATEGKFNARDTRSKLSEIAQSSESQYLQLGRPWNQLDLNCALFIYAATFLMTEKEAEKINQTTFREENKVDCFLLKTIADKKRELKNYFQEPTNRYFTQDEVMLLLLDDLDKDKQLEVNPPVTRRNLKEKMNDCCYYAAAAGIIYLMEALLKYGADVNSPDPTYGNYPLHAAAFSRHSDMVDLLLRSGANPELKNKHGAAAFDQLGYQDTKEIKNSIDYSLYGTECHNIYRLFMVFLQLRILRSKVSEHTEDIRTSNKIFLTLPEDIMLLIPTHLPESNSLNKLQIAKISEFSQSVFNDRKLWFKKEFKRDEWFTSQKFFQTINQPTERKYEKQLPLDPISRHSSAN